MGYIGNIFMMATPRSNSGCVGKPAALQHARAKDAEE
jgi:hypothetical protein